MTFKRGKTWIAQGLRNHYHQYAFGKTWRRTDDDGIVYRYHKEFCIICGKSRIEKSIIDYKPRIDKSKALNKQKSKYKG